MQILLVCCCQLRPPCMCDAIRHQPPTAETCGRSSSMTCWPASNGKFFSFVENQRRRLGYVASPAVSCLTGPLHWPHGHYGSSSTTTTLCAMHGVCSAKTKWLFKRV
jgi:hypothetical protein